MGLLTILFKKHQIPFQTFSVVIPSDWRVIQPPPNMTKILHTLSRVVKVLVAQSCPTLCNPMDCSLPSSSAHGILQAKILEWVSISFSRGSSQLRDRTWVSYVSCIAGIFFTPWVIREAQENSIAVPQKIKNWTIVWSGNSTLGIYPKELKARSHIEFCTPMFIATLFTVAKI